jgi:hypothetical protein
MRLGEFDPDLKRKSSFENKREQFLHKVETRAPRVVRSLYDEVFLPYQADLPTSKIINELDDLALLKTYKKAHPKSRLSGRELENAAYYYWRSHNEGLSFWHCFLAADKSHHPQLIPIREAIIKWSDYWNLNADWCRDRAIRQLFAWTDEVWETDHTEWGAMPYGRLVEINKQEERRLLPSEDFPRWMPFEQKLNEYLDQQEQELREYITKHPVMAAMFEGYLKSHINDLIKRIRDEMRLNYCEKLADYYEEHKYIRISIEPRIDKHMEWTVRVRILCRTSDEVTQTFERIAKEESYSENAIRKAVREILTEIGLPLQPTFLPSRGRPPR